jgi:hypothetical protein
MKKHTNSPQGYPGGCNGPAAVLQYTRTEATWRCAISQSAADLEPGTCQTPYHGMLAAEAGAPPMAARPPADEQVRRKRGEKGRKRTAAVMAHSLEAPFGQLRIMQRILSYLRQCCRRRPPVLAVYTAMKMADVHGIKAHVFPSRAFSTWQPRGRRLLLE